MLGATDRGIPSAQGRALASVGPAVAEVEPDLPVAVAVRGPSVLTLSCPRLAEVRQDCAAGAAPEFRVDRALPWRSALVDVQLDLRGQRADLQQTGAGRIGGRRDARWLSGVRAARQGNRQYE